MKKEMFDLDCQDDGLFKYPPIKKVAFEDGTIQTYVHIDRISPQLARAESALRTSIRVSVGYLPRSRRKNRIHRCER